MNERIRWAGKVSQAKIRRLYLTDAKGIIDEELIDEVGTAFFSRCHSIILVSNRQVECPICGQVIQIPPGLPDDGAFACPGRDCTWATTHGEWHKSWRHQDLIGVRAISAFERYVERYPRATQPREKMFLIDQLIHAFHHGIKAGVPHRSVANNLIQGNHKQVVAFLDKLTYGSRSTPGLESRHGAWQEQVHKMWHFRRSAPDQD